MFYNKKKVVKDLERFFLNVQGLSDGKVAS